MLSEFANEYVHVHSMGDLVNCRSIIKQTKEQIQPLYDIKKIIGYQLLLIKDNHDFEEQFIPNNLEELTKGNFPFVYAVVQSVENKKIDIDQIMEKLDYIKVDV